MEKVVKLSNLVAPSFKSVHHAIKNKAYTHYLLSGGRGSTKSSFISVEIVKGIMEDPFANAVVMRKVKDTLKRSVYQQIKWAIENLGVEEYWNIPKAELTFTYIPTGQTIIFAGVDEPKKIKGTKFSRGYGKFIWFEELDEFDGMDEVRTVTQSLMRGGEKFVVFYSFNPPKSGNSWVNVERKITRSDRLNHHSDYTTVPSEWLGDPFLQEVEHLKETNFTAYQHEYLGLAVGTGGEVFNNVTCRPITDDEIKEFYNVKRGLDFGFARDPLSYVTSHYDRKKKTLYIYGETYKVGMHNWEINEIMIKENPDNEFVYVESAEPKSISELLQYGRNVVGVKKGKDSVNYGTRFLQALDAIIIDNERCPETAREFLTYELDRDVHGNYKAGYPDRNNHSIDAVRYSLNEEALQFRENKGKIVEVGMTMEDRIRENMRTGGVKTQKRGAWTF